MEAADEDQHVLARVPENYDKLVALKANLEDLPTAILLEVLPAEFDSVCQAWLAKTEPFTAQDLLAALKDCEVMWETKDIQSDLEKSVEDLAY